MRRALVRYQVTPEYADHNQRRIEAVYRELAELAPADFRYTTYRFDDGVTFEHVIEQDTEGETPLRKLPAFQEFLDNLPEHYTAEAVTSEATRLGTYGFPPAA